MAMLVLILCFIFQRRVHCLKYFLLQVENKKIIFLLNYLKNICQKYILQRIFDIWTLYKTSQKIQEYYFLILQFHRLNTPVRNHWNFVAVILLFTMYNVPPWTREGEWEMWLFQHSSVSNDTALWIKWPCLFCRTVCTQMDQYKLVFNRNVHFSGGNTLIFWLIPPQKSSCTWASKYLFNFQFSTPFQFSAKQGKILVLLWIVTAFLPYQ